MNTMRGQQDQQSRVFCELSALVFNLLRSPPLMPDSSSRRSPAVAQITPAGFASLLLGISVALMLCGSVTFFIGFMLMPWVLGLVMVFYVAAVVSALSVLGRSILCFASPRKDLPALGELAIDISQIDRLQFSILKNLNLLLPHRKIM
ncbi:hypothetical protein VNO80_10445 [Phaseolus coccineus]|uniref:Transmembrane protein n=1 Tax=Phaseolus coccineus TaxID=3886 RepID=A0AAN9RAG7_PHACN